MNLLKNKKGQSILEVIIAMAIFGLAASSLVSFLLGGDQYMRQGGDQVKAEALAQAGMEAVRSVRDEAWNNINLNQIEVSQDGSTWSLIDDTDLDGEIIGKFTRFITVSDVCRDESDGIIDCPGQYKDVYSKKIEVVVSWEVRSGIINSVQRVSYLTNWNSHDWVQSDWSGGDGQSVWLVDNQYDTDDSNIDISTEGEIKLASIGGGGCGVKVWSFSNALNYTYNDSEIEVTGGVAQLVGDDSCSGTPTTCSSYGDQTACEGQSGCSWTVGEGSCQNNGICAGLPNDQCIDCGGSGCSVAGRNCKGTLDCSVHLDQVSCESCGQCLWGTSGGSCSGTPTPCENYSDIISCEDQDGCSWSGSYPTNNPAIYPSSSYIADDISQWSSFTEIAQKNGGEIYYQLSDDDGVTWQYWDSSSWSEAGITDYNTADVINSNISSFPTANSQIMFRAFLSSDGTQQIQLDEVSISCVKSQTWPFFNALNYIYNDSEIEVTGGVAQLVGDDSCSGTPTTCSSYGDQTACEGQSGCSWTVGEGSCQNNGICAGLPNDQCIDCGGSGCSVAGRNCKGTLDCSLHLDQASCESCGQCLWGTSGGSCSGTPMPCEDYLDITSCENQAGCSWSGSYPTSNPTIYPSTSYVADDISRWSSFTEIAQKNGGEIYYQLSDDDGVTWQYWNNTDWSTAGITDYNTADVINNNISSFPTTNSQIMFRAFLSSDGTQQIQLDEVSISQYEAGIESSYSTSGYLISSAFNTGYNSPLQVIEWEETVPICVPECSVKTQVRVAPDSGGVPGAWSDWHGISGINTYFTIAAGNLMPLELNGNQWVQYRVELAGDGDNTPILEGITLNYK